MQNYKLEAQQRLKSIYNPRKKTKGNSMFPKIHRVQLSPVQSKPIIKGLNKKYRNNDNIFKKQDEKPSNRNLKIQEQKIIYSKQYEQLQLVIADCRRKHLEQLSIIQMKQKETAKLIQNSKKQSYNSKLSMWELKNQVLELEQLLKDQEEEYNKLCYELGYVQNQNGELQYAQQQELEDQMNNYDEGQQFEQANFKKQFQQNQYQNQSQLVNKFDNQQNPQISEQQHMSVLAQSQHSFSAYHSENVNYSNLKDNNYCINSKLEQKVGLITQS